jgi:hypothetical protein
MLLSGDIAGGVWDVSHDWYDNVEGSSDIMCIIGNHDTYDAYGEKGRTATEQDCYEHYLAKNIASWGVVYQENKCYWYKDYDVQKIRLIGLDCMHPTDEQDTWFENILEDARTKGYSVVVTHHFNGVGKEDTDGFSCNFNSLQEKSLDPVLNYHRRVMPIVDTFQNNGGDFICWLGGHCHTDFCGVSKQYPRQMYIVIGDASHDSIWCDCNRVVGTKSQDLFNIFSIDPSTKMIKMIRIGANVNRFMQHRNAICFDWANRKVVSEW